MTLTQISVTDWTGRPTDESQETRSTSNFAEEHSGAATCGRFDALSQASYLLRPQVATYSHVPSLATGPDRTGPDRTGHKQISEGIRIFDVFVLRLRCFDEYVLRRFG